MTTSPKEIIREAQSYADKQIGGAETFLNRLADLATVNLNVETPEFPGFEMYDKSRELLNELMSARPERPNVRMELGAVPQAPNVNVSGGIHVQVPEFEGEVPQLEYPDAPSITLPHPPGAPSFGDYFSIPERPSIALPQPPGILAADIPAPPVADGIEPFDLEVPVFDVLPSGETFQFNETEFTSALKDVVVAALIAELEGGGHGMSAEVESALWERAREREVESVNAAVEGVRREYAAAGFPVPPGAMYAAIGRAYEKGALAVSTLSREIAIKQTELEREAWRYAMDKGIAVTQLMMDYHGALMERTLRASQAVYESGARVFNLQVEGYRARLEGFKNAAEFYNLRLRKVSADMEMYKARVEAETARVGVRNEAQLNAYKVQLEGANAAMGLYKTEMEAANVYAVVERTRLDAFKMNMDAYRLLLASREIEFRLYESRMKGESEKMHIYEAELDGYRMRLEGAKTEVQIKQADFQSRHEAAQLRLHEYATELDGYKTLLAKVTAEIKAQMDFYDSDVTAYRFEAEAVNKSYDMYMETGKINADSKIEAARQSISRAQLELSKVKDQAQLRLQSSISATDVYKNMASGALSAINALASVTETIESK